MSTLTLAQVLEAKVAAGMISNSFPNWRMCLDSNIERGRRVLTADD